MNLENKLRELYTLGQDIFKCPIHIEIKPTEDIFNQIKYLDNCNETNDGLVMIGISGSTLTVTK